MQYHAFTYYTGPTLVETGGNREAQTLTLIWGARVSVQVLSGSEVFRKAPAEHRNLCSIASTNCLFVVVAAAILVHLHLHQLGKMPKQHIKGGAAVKGKPKHSLDEGRRDGKNGTRTAATVRRLKMYKSRPVRNSKGHMLSNEYQSKALPSTRIQPDRRWFGKCRIGGDMIKFGFVRAQGFASII
jgi:hypothetical protein